MKVKVPLRLTLAGGGSDLPAHYRRHGGFVVSAAIDKYLTVEITPRGRLGGMVIDDAGHFRPSPPHPYATAAGWPKDTLVDIASDIPSGSGLGGSGALIVALLLARYPELDANRAELAQAAYNLERYTLGKSCGLQDHWVAALGTVALDVDRDATVTSYPTFLPDGFASRLVLLHTGLQHDASQVLARQAESVRSQHDAEKAMQVIERIGYEIWRDLQTGGKRFGELTLAHWRAKRATEPSITTPQIDQWIEQGLALGAEGAKLCGAGAGGYLLFVVPPDRREVLVSEMVNKGLVEMPFRFTEDRAEIIQEYK